MEREYHFYVYILASRRNGTLYIGMTNDLVVRVRQHKLGKVKGFTQKYNVKQLVWFEHFGDVQLAIQRETSMKRWLRQWKISLIEKANPNWIYLFERLERDGDYSILEQTSELHYGFSAQGRE